MHTKKPCSKLKKKIAPKKPRLAKFYRENENGANLAFLQKKLSVYTKLVGFCTQLSI